MPSIMISPATFDDFRQVILHAVENETNNNFLPNERPCSRDAESSERSACGALRSEDSASRLHGVFVSFLTACSISGK